MFPGLYLGWIESTEVLSTTCTRIRSAIVTWSLRTFSSWLRTWGSPTIPRGWKCFNGAPRCLDDGSWSWCLLIVEWWCHSCEKGLEFLIWFTTVAFHHDPKWQQNHSFPPLHRLKRGRSQSLCQTPPAFSKASSAFPENHGHFEPCCKKASHVGSEASARRTYPIGSSSAMLWRP